MQVDEKEPILKKIRIGELEPRLRSEIEDLARELGHESAISASSNLHFLFKLYQAERVKEKGSSKKLKKAEEMILRLSSLHFEIQQRENARRKTESKKRAPGMLEGAPQASKRARDALAQIGIADEEIASKAEAMLGTDGVEARAELVLLSNLGEELAKKIFSAHPEFILTPKDKDFVLEIEAMENKKYIIDAWKSSHEGDVPSFVDYEKTPGILVDKLSEFNRQLDLASVQPEPPAMKEEEEKKLFKYVPRPMDKAEMISILGVLGYSFKRKVKELVFEGPGGRKLTTSDPHDGEYNPITVRRIMRDMGVSPSEFEEARRKAEGKI